MNNTLVKYMYRDASNYKFYGEFVVSDLLLRSNIEDFLFDGEFFVPHEIGLDHLQNYPMNENDHYLHTFENFEATDMTNTICSAAEFIKRVKLVHKKGWLYSLAG